MADNFIDISVDEREFNQTLEYFEKRKEAITPEWLKSTQRRKLGPIVNAMKQRSPSKRLKEMISVTTAKKRAGKYGAKVGVVKNNKDKFPTFSAQALASVLEYGTGERFRNLKSFGIVTGRQSTGSVKPQKFLRDSWDTNVNQFMKDTEQAILDKIEKG